MNINELKSQFRMNERITTWVSHIIVPLLLVCLAVAFVGIIHRVMIGWDLTYLIWLSFLVSMEAMIANYRLHLVREERPNILLYRLVEWISIMIVLKIVQYLEVGISQLLLDLPNWQENFFEVIFNGEFIVGNVILLMSGASTFSMRI
jgi:hypothetical protein